MKKFAIISFLFLFFGLNLFADEQTEQENSWDFFGLVFFPGVPTSSNDSNIAGIRVGVPIAGGNNEVRGIEVGVFACMTQTVYGIQTAPLFCTCNKFTGFQASPVNISDNVNGLQFGLFNYCKDASFQLGILNYNKDAVIPWLPIINWNF